MLDQRPGFGGNFRQPGNAATRRAGIGIDAGEPGNETAAQQRQPCRAIPRDRRVGIGRLQRPLDRRLDRAFDPAERFIMRQLESAASVVLAVEPLQREGEQRQRVLGAARLDIGQQRIDQSVLDVERAWRPAPAAAPAP